MSKVVCSESCSNIPRFISQIDVMDYAALVQPPAVVEDPISDDASQLLGDETGVEQFLASSKPAERRMALLASSSSTDDSCIVQSLLGAGADVNARGGTGNTPLMNAALFGYLSDMRALLLAGAKVNDRDTAGETALMMAASMGFVDGVKMLVDAGADPSIVSKIGTTALNLAVKFRHADVAELIRQSQAQHRQLR
jgi:ankyrin repeat protein